jgi:hypothetical protein
MGILKYSDAFTRAKGMRFFLGGLRENRVLFRISIALDEIAAGGFALFHNTTK